MSEPRQGPDQTGASGYPANTDPAYSGQYWTPGYSDPTYGGQTYGAQSYGQGYGAPMAQPTEQLPAYWQPGTGYQAGPPPPPPQPPKSPRWLWIVATVAVLLVAGLVLALVIVSNSARESTTVAPANPTTTSAQPTPTQLPTTTRGPLPTVTILPGPSTRPGTTTPTTPGGPDQTTSPTGTETVVYSVSGEGRAINITYVDTGGVMQTEFNVALPWSKEVSLSAPAKPSASVAVVNVGRDVTCSVSVNGAQVRQRTGRGLTICSGLG